MKSFSDHLAKLISGISSPFVVGTAAIVLLIVCRPETSARAWYWLIWYVGLTTVLPLAYVLFQVARGKITDVHVNLREQRILPFVVAICSVTLLLAVLLYLQAPRILVVMTINTLIDGVILLTCSRYFKISIHAAALASTITALDMLVSPIYFLGYLTLPIVMWARLKRGRHTVNQFLLGTGIAALVTAVVYRLFGF